MIAFTSSTATDVEDMSSGEGGLVRMSESGGIAVAIRLSYTPCDGVDAIVSNTSSTIAVNTGSGVDLWLVWSSFFCPDGNAYL